MEAVVPAALFVRELQMHQTKCFFITELSIKNIPDKSVQERDFLVDPTTGTVEREANSDTEPRSSNRNPCISAGVGISLPRIDAKEGGGQMECPRETASHKCI